MDKSHVILSSYVKGNVLQVERAELMESQVSSKVHAISVGKFSPQGLTRPHRDSTNKH